MPQADVYTTGPLRGLPIRRAIDTLSAMPPEARRAWADGNPDLAKPGTVIHLTEDAVTAWRDQVLFDGAVVGDVAMNDAAVEAADAPSPIDWQPEPHGHTGTAICVVIMLCTVGWAAFRIVTSAGAA